MESGNTYTRRRVIGDCMLLDLSNLARALAPPSQSVWHNKWQNLKHDTIQQITNRGHKFPHINKTPKCNYQNKPHLIDHRPKYGYTNGNGQHLPTNWRHLRLSFDLIKCFCQAFGTISPWSSTSEKAWKHCTTQQTIKFKQISKTSTISYENIKVMIRTKPHLIIHSQSKNIETQKIENRLSTWRPSFDFSGFERALPQSLPWWLSVIKHNKWGSLKTYYNKIFADINKLMKTCEHLNKH